MRRPVTAGGLVLFLGLASCSGGTTEPHDGWVRVIGTLGEVVVPDQVTAGEPFSITVNTRGSVGCIRIASTEVTVEHSVARVVPYDSVASPCIQQSPAIMSVPHDAAVLFASPGEATVRVVGYPQSVCAALMCQGLDSLDFPVVVVP